MKHLRRFNEELKSRTYKRVAKKLADIGHIKRASAMEDHIKEVEKREHQEFIDKNLIGWREAVDKYSKYGKFRMVLGDPLKETIRHAKGVKSIMRGFREGDFINDEFYVALDFESDMWIDNLYDYDQNREKPEDERSYPVRIWANISMMIFPTTEETLIKILNSERYKHDVYSGKLFSGWWTFDTLIESEVKSSVKTMTFSEDDGRDYVALIADRKSAGGLKNLIVNILSDKIEYPIYWGNEFKTLHDQFETFVCNRSGLASDYGITIDHYIEAAKAVNPNNLFKEF